MNTIFTKAILFCLISIGSLPATAAPIEIPTVRYGSGPGRCLDVEITNAATTGSTVTVSLSGEGVEFCRASVSPCTEVSQLRPGDTCRVGVRLAHAIDDAIHPSLIVNQSTDGRASRRTVIDLAGYPSKSRADAIAVTRKLLREALGSDPARRSLALRALERNEAAGRGPGAAVYRKSF